MKKSLFFALLLLGMSFFFVSCEKEGKSDNSGIIEGKWWVAEKADYVFNGITTYSSSDFEIRMQRINKLKLENNIATFLCKSGSTYTYSYSIDNSSLIIDYATYTIKSVSHDTFVIERSVSESSNVGEIDSNDSYLTTYKGTDIFTSRNGFAYYLGANGNAVACGAINGELWFDSQISYFKSE